METGHVITLIASVCLLLVGALVVLASVALLYTFRNIRPVEILENDFSALHARVDGLESQIVKLRTQKAGRRSVENRQQPEVDPTLEGLNEDERALFM